MNNPKILFLYDYFDPAYKAGGPIRSLVNLVHLLESHYDIYILASHQDHDGSVLDVTTDEWITYGNGSRVKYLSKENRGYRSIKKEILEVDPKVVYLNGVYSLPFVVYPLWILMGIPKVKVVIAPRGMLQEGALKIKRKKKGIYLFLLTILLKRQNQLVWQATDGQEQRDILKYNSSNQIQRVGNVPAFTKLTSKEIVQIPTFDFVSISLLTQKKNHLSFIQALHSLGSDRKIVYHIYGPISDEGYFQTLTDEIKHLPDNIIVEYKGIIHPKNVPEILNQYKFYILTSFGENFGHSIFEAFNQGIPVIISDQTPWKNLYAKQAGWDVDLNTPNALSLAIEQALEMDDVTYLQFRKGARAIAEKYMGDNDFIKDYRELFVILPPLSHSAHPLVIP